MGSNREKSNIAIAILEKLPFLKGNKKISHFDGSNNIFADCNLTYEETIYYKGFLYNNNMSDTITENNIGAPKKRNKFWCHPIVYLKYHCKISFGINSNYLSL